ncbi:hypothetical protein [Streptomyces sp. NBC_00083]|uniref:hypothetical protein n=1 Tax=Streptomyces sp. NBC_00083 TaxID=2975647 RepID=UPI002253D259|nr:hypothetical protein [Streptomyces sp. NBC_00083]MCX5385346.1 hypothetical protein [Streptomyces sp. NBC_00083]
MSAIAPAAASAGVVQPPGGVAQLGWFSEPGGLRAGLGRAWLRRRAKASPAAQAMVGAAGRVVTPIPRGGYGEVLFCVHGRPLKYAARARVPLDFGARVRVSAALSPSAIEVAHLGPAVDGRP